MECVNSINNQYFMKNANNQLKRYAKKLGEIKILNKFKREKLLNEIILENIEAGLSFGYPSVRYYIHNNETKYLSIEAECKDYHNPENINEKMYESVFYSMTEILIPQWIEENKHKYKNLNIVVDEDEYGKYFEVSFGEKWALHIEI